MNDLDALKRALRTARLKSYAEVRGGFPIPLAGAIYWAALGAAGYAVDPQNWNLIAFVASGAIFPLAVVLAQIFRNPFMKANGPVDGALVPAFIGMLLFWPAAFVAFGRAPELVPLILSIGMSAHWPVIGWMYGRAALFSAHSLVRAIAVVAIFVLLPPPAHTTLLPFAVSAIYVATVIAIFIDSSAVRRRLASAPA